MRVSPFKNRSVCALFPVTQKHFFNPAQIFAFLFLIVIAYFPQTVIAEEKFPVRLTEDIPFITITHQGREIVVKRIQDTKNRLIDDFSKTSRPCPPFCIHPMSAAPDVETYGELELLKFIRDKVDNDKGLLIDARMPRFFNTETIPGSVNIPFVLFASSKITKVLDLLGAKSNSKDDKLDFSQTIELCLFCNGPWCDQSPRAIRALIKAGYPTNKLKYYRGGMQVWKLFSLTTVLPQSNIVGEVKTNE